MEKKKVNKGIVGEGSFSIIDQIALAVPLNSGFESIEKLANIIRSTAEDELAASKTPNAKGFGAAFKMINVVVTKRLR